MLFRKVDNPSCSLCARGVEIDERDVLCRRFGVVSRSYKCRKFRYDPQKRLPVRTPKLREMDADSFKLG